MGSNPTVTATVEAPRTLGNTGIAGLLSFTNSACGKDLGKNVLPDGLSGAFRRSERRARTTRCALMWAGVRKVYAARIDSWQEWAEVSYAAQG